MSSNEKPIYDPVTKSCSATVLDDPARRIQYELGDSKQSAIFYPQFKTMHWDNECNFSVRLDDADFASGAAQQKADGTVQWTRGGRTVNLYSKSSADENGAFEFETILTAPPVSNVLTFTLQTKGFQFNYQPELTETEVKGGHTRPENVVGSYAVYHESKANNEAGSKAYRTGKAFHIYRPWAEDSNGVRVWCDLLIDAGLLTIIIPQNFLDSAVYPVLVDPTFGYTSAGASNANIANVARASKANLSVAGSVTKISAYVTVVGAGTDGAAAVYAYTSDTDAGALNGGAGSSTTNMPIAVNGLNDFTISRSLPATDYFLAVLATSVAGTADLAYDASSGFGVAQGGLTFPTFPDPFVEGGADGNLYSIYATYTASGGLAIPVVIRQFRQRWG